MTVHMEKEVRKTAEGEYLVGVPCPLPSKCG